VSEGAQVMLMNQLHRGLNYGSASCATAGSQPGLVILGGGLRTSLLELLVRVHEHALALGADSPLEVRPGVKLADCQCRCSPIRLCACTVCFERRCKCR
jgi:hypothetical protein